MDEIYGINLAKTEFREAYNTGDVDRLLAVFNPDGFTDMSGGGPSKYGPEARARLSEQSSKLFSEYSVKLTPIIIDIAVLGDTAYDYGWHEFTLRSKNGGEQIRKRHRYFELWSKTASGEWKISLHITNEDVREELRGFVSHWFLSEERDRAASLPN
jgi:ketosteroid isomerase-like protein